MSALFVLIAVSIVIAGSFLGAFLWSVGNGQYEDDYTPSVRILFDDDIKDAVKIKSTEQHEIADNKNKQKK